jgi:purine-binding chemotaxis protein CheW
MTPLPPRAVPLDAGAVLAERARLLAKPVDDRQVVDDHSSWSVTFLVGGAPHALDTSHVLEVMRPGALAPVPGAPPLLLGVTTLRGAVLPVFDLGALLGQAPAPAGPTALALVLGRDAPDLAFAVTEVLDVGPAPAGLLSPLPPSLASAPGPLCTGVRADGAVVLDGAALLADPRLAPPPDGTVAGSTVPSRRNP